MPTAPVKILATALLCAVALNTPSQAQAASPPVPMAGPIDGSVLPILEPNMPVYTELDARNAKPWELYNLNEDPTELNNLASQHPLKLAEMKALFDPEARANNVYPLINWSDLSIGITDFQRKSGLLPPAPAPNK